MRQFVRIACIASLLASCKKDAPSDAAALPASAKTAAAAAPVSVPASSMRTAVAPLASPFASRAPTKGRCRPRIADAPKPIRGAGSFVTRDGKISVAVNDDGVPRFVDDVNGALKASRSPCAAAADTLYCASTKGIIRRYDAKGAASDVTEGAASAQLAAAKLGDREVVAFLRAVQTPSGVVREAWARTSEGQVVKISDDGAGATSLDIVTSNERITFLTVEARTSLATLTARNASVKDGRLVLAPATVVFAGGGGDYLLEPRGVALSGGRLLLATVLPQDLHAFGSAVFILDANHLTNIEPVWSLYPRGLDDAAFAVTVHQGKTWMVRVKPTSAEGHSALALEVGQLDEAGRFVTFGERMAPENPAHLALASDRDALVMYVDGDRGGQRERWVCGEAR